MKNNKNELYYPEWLEKADDDIKWAENSFEGGFYDGVCLLSQQIIEKTLKAYLISQDKGLQKIHNLPKLLTSCAKIDLQFQEYKESCDKINQYYIDTRYPGDLIIVNKKDASEALSAAKEIFNFVKGKTK